MVPRKVPEEPAKTDETNKRTTETI